MQPEAITDEFLEDLLKHFESLKGDEYLELKYKKLSILLLSRIMADTYDGKGSPSHRVLAKMADMLLEEIDSKIQQVKFFSPDSRVIN